MHKFSSRCNYVGVPLKIGSRLLFLLLFAVVTLEPSLHCDTLLFLLYFPESPGPLLVQLGSRSYTVNCQINELLRSGKGHDGVGVLKYIVENIFNALRSRAILRPSTGMDDTIHVEVQVVNLGVSVYGLGLVTVNVQRHGLVLKRLDLSHGFLFLLVG